MNKAVFETYKNTVEIELIRIESDYYYLQSSQVADFPKEREK